MNIAFAANSRKAEAVFPERVESGGPTAAGLPQTGGAGGDLATKP